MVLSRYMRAWRGAALAAVLLAAGLAQAANDYFLQIDGIPGESIDRDHPKWIDIDSFSWGLTMATGGAGSTGVGKATFSDFAWTQPVDASTPKWFLAVATGKHIPNVTLDVTRVSGARSDSFFQMIFTSTVGTGMHVAGATDLTESASMTSGEIVKLRYRPQDAKGAYGAWVEGSFNIREGFATALFTGDERVLLGLFGSGGSIAFDGGAVTTVPEPASAALLLAGLGLVAVRRRRRP